MKKLLILISVVIALMIIGSFLVFDKPPLLSETSVESEPATKQTITPTKVQVNTTTQKTKTAATTLDRTSFTVTFKVR